ncbi:MAG: hypothetical protein ACK55Z_10300, partial [bacterium]
VKLRLIFAHLTQTHLGRAFFFAGNDPLIAEAGAILFHRRLAERLAALLHGLHIHPHFFRLEDVVIAEGEEVVAALLVPVDHHLGEVIAIAPERVSVRVAFEPFGLGGGGKNGEEKQGEKAVHGSQTARNKGSDKKNTPRHA